MSCLRAGRRCCDLSDRCCDEKTQPHRPAFKDGTAACGVSPVTHWGAWSQQRCAPAVPEGAVRSGASEWEEEQKNAYAMTISRYATAHAVIVAAFAVLPRVTIPFPIESSKERDVAVKPTDDDAPPDKKLKEGDAGRELRFVSVPQYGSYGRRPEVVEGCRAATPISRLVIRKHARLGLHGPGVEPG